MEINLTIDINKPADQVWELVADNFDRAMDWMAIVPKSYKKTEGEIVANAPNAGRVCEFSSKEDGLKADESITLFDVENKRLGIRVVPINPPKLLPLIHNDLVITVEEIDKSSSRVNWLSKPTLKSSARFFKPLIKMGIKKSFNEILEELKYYLENGKVHPRKAKKERA